MPIFDLSIWLQIHGLLAGFRPKKSSIGNYVGKFVKSDMWNFDGNWKSFVRICVLIDIRKPLKDQMKLKRNGDEWILMKF